jgi:hypothetical protein
MGLEDDLRALQIELRRDPEKGRVEPGTGGLRKVRMAYSKRQRGKRGGARVHYLYRPRRALIYLIFVYAKNESEKLSHEQKKALRSVVERIKGEG